MSSTMKHGQHENCGRDYATDESTVTAYCTACGEKFTAEHQKFPRGTIVRHTSKALKSIYGQGGKGAPINGRIVGATSSWPIVQWSDGYTFPVAEASLQKVR